MTPYEIAKTFIGLKEVNGTANNESIIKMLQLVDKNIVEDETPWCSAFVNWVAKQSNSQMSNSLMARSWLKIGEPITLENAIAATDVVILKRNGSGLPSIANQPGADVVNYPGHVGFYHSHNDKTISLLGGNQGDQVIIKEYPIIWLLGIRRITKLNILSKPEENLGNYGFDMDDIFKYGDRNSGVLEVQKSLKLLDFYASEVDGIFGRITENAVKKYQTSKGLKADGIVGKKTIQVLQSKPTVVSEDWVARALSMISFFETSSKYPWTSISGDFDQMGISCGVLQWNIGQDSLQPFIKELGQSLVKKTMPKFGAILWEASIIDTKDGLSLVRKNFINPKDKDVKTEVKDELKILLNSSESKTIQISKFNNLAKKAKSAADNWALEYRGEHNCTRDEFLWFYDLFTLNGNLEGLTVQKVKNFIQQNQKEIPTIYFEWLRNYPKEVIVDGKKEKTFWVKDIEKNISIWQQIPLSTIQKQLFALSYLRAQTSRLHFKVLTMIRKSTISTGKGFVNGEEIDINLI